jgi:hypothetical protein
VKTHADDSDKQVRMGFWRHVLHYAAISWPTLAFTLWLWFGLAMLMQAAGASDAAFTTGMVLVLLLQWEMQP